MITRIVQLTFKEEKVDAFLDHFEKVKTKIRNFEGCHYLTLYQDQYKKNMFFTYSIWESEIALNNYRNSMFFIKVWETTKQLFKEQPKAWTLNNIITLD